MKLQPGEVVSLFSGKDGFRLPTRPYFKDPRFTGMYRPNPLFNNPVPPADPLQPADRAKEAASKAAEWAKTEGADQALAAASAAVAGAVRVSKWLGARFRRDQGQKGDNKAPDDTPRS
jgi:type IV secretory pathway TraG/TraD family ATPase VirD4